MSLGATRGTRDTWLIAVSWAALATAFVCAGWILFTVFGLGLTVAGTALLAEYLGDYILALALGIGFQYLAIAPPGQSTHGSSAPVSRKPWEPPRPRIRFNGGTALR